MRLAGLLLLQIILLEFMAAVAAMLSQVTGPFIPEASCNRSTVGPSLDGYSPHT